MGPRKHSKLLDKKFGYRINKVENKLSQKYREYDLNERPDQKKKHFPGCEAWIGLDPGALQTPYSEIYRAFSFLKDQKVERIVDIGAGYGRVAFVMNAIFKDCEFIGYEIVKKRQVEGQRVFDHMLFDKSSLVNENVLTGEFELPEADVYFIYDFSESGDLDMILKHLDKMRERREFFLIAKGTRLASLMATKYTSYKKELEIKSQTDLTVYSSKFLAS